MPVINIEEDIYGVSQAIPTTAPSGVSYMDYTPGMDIKPPGPRDLRIRPFGEEAGEAVSRGVHGLKSAGYGALGILGSATGIESLRDYGYKEALEQEKQAEAHPAAIPGYEDIQGIGDIPRYALSLAFEQVPNIGLTAATTLLTGGVGALVSGGARAGAVLAGSAAVKKSIAEVGAKLATKSTAELIAKGWSTEEAATMSAELVSSLLPKTTAKAISTRGAELGMKTGIIAGTAPIEAGGGWVENMQAGYDTPWTSITQGTMAGFVELLGGSSKFINLIFHPNTKNMGAKALGHFFRAASEMMGQEAGQEALQEALTIMAHATHDPNFEPTAKEQISRIINSAIAGAVVGTAYGGPSMIMQRGGGKRVVTQEERDLGLPSKPIPEPPVIPPMGSTGIDLEAAQQNRQDNINMLTQVGVAIGGNNPEFTLIDGKLPNAENIDTYQTVKNLHTQLSEDPEFKPKKNSREAIHFKTVGNWLKEVERNNKEIIGVKTKAAGVTGQVVPGILEEAKRAGTLQENITPVTVPDIESTPEDMKAFNDLVARHPEPSQVAKPIKDVLWENTEVGDIVRDKKTGATFEITDSKTGTGGLANVREVIYPFDTDRPLFTDTKMPEVNKLVASNIVSMSRSMESRAYINAYGVGSFVGNKLDRFRKRKPGVKFTKSNVNEIVQEITQDQKPTKPLKSEKIISKPTSELVHIEPKQRTDMFSTIPSIAEEDIIKQHPKSMAEINQLLIAEENAGKDISGLISKLKTEDGLGRFLKRVKGENVKYGILLKTQEHERTLKETGPTYPEITPLTPGVPNIKVRVAKEGWERTSDHGYAKKNEARDAAISLQRKYKGKTYGVSLQQGQYYVVKPKTVYKEEGVSEAGVGLTSNEQRKQHARSLFNTIVKSDEKIKTAFLKEVLIPWSQDHVPKIIANQKVKVTAGKQIKGRLTGADRVLANWAARVKDYKDRLIEPTKNINVQDIIDEVLPSLALNQQGNNLLKAFEAKHKIKVEGVKAEEITRESVPEFNRLIEGKVETGEEMLKTAEKEKKAEKLKYEKAAEKTRLTFLSKAKDSKGERLLLAIREALLGARVRLTDERGTKISHLEDRIVDKYGKAIDARDKIIEMLVSGYIKENHLEIRKRFDSVKGITPNDVKTLLIDLAKLTNANEEVRQLMKEQTEGITEASTIEMLSTTEEKVATGEVKSRRKLSAEEKEKTILQMVEQSLSKQELEGMSPAFRKIYQEQLKKQGVVSVKKVESEVVKEVKKAKVETQAQGFGVEKPAPKRKPKELSLKPGDKYTFINKDRKEVKVEIVGDMYESTGTIGARYTIVGNRQQYIRGKREQIINALHSLGDIVSFTPYKRVKVKPIEIKKEAKPPVVKEAKVPKPIVQKPVAQSITTVAPTVTSQSSKLLTATQLAGGWTIANRPEFAKTKAEWITTLKENPGWKLYNDKTQYKLLLTKDPDSELYHLAILKVKPIVPELDRGWKKVTIDPNVGLQTVLQQFPKNKWIRDESEVIHNPNGTESGVLKVRVKPGIFTTKELSTSTIHEARAAAELIDATIKPKTFNEFVLAMRERLGAAWDSIKQYANDLWNWIRYKREISSLPVHTKPELMIREKIDFAIKSDPVALDKELIRRTNAIAKDLYELKNNKLANRWAHYKNIKFFTTSRNNAYYSDTFRLISERFDISKVQLEKLLQYLFYKEFIGDKSVQDLLGMKFGEEIKSVQQFRQGIAARTSPMTLNLTKTRVFFRSMAERGLSLFQLPSTHWLAGHATQRRSSPIFMREITENMDKILAGNYNGVSVSSIIKASEAKNFAFLRDNDIKIKHGNMRIRGEKNKIILVNEIQIRQGDRPYRVFRKIDNKWYMLFDPKECWTNREIPIKNIIESIKANKKCPIKEGYTRLYRGEDSEMKMTPDEYTGKFWTKSLPEAATYGDRIWYLDIPSDKISGTDVFLASGKREEVNARLFSPGYYDIGHKVFELLEDNKRNDAINVLEKESDNVLTELSKQLKSVDEADIKNKQIADIDQAKLIGPPPVESRSLTQDEIQARLPGSTITKVKGKRDTYDITLPNGFVFSLINGDRVEIKGTDKFQYGSFSSITEAGPALMTVADLNDFTLDHETLHMVMNIFMTKGEQRNAYELHRTESSQSDQDVRESFANTYALWRSKQGDFTSQQISIFEKIKQWARDLVDWFRGFFYGTRKEILAMRQKKLFEAIRTGRIYNRTPQLNLVQFPTHKFALEMNANGLPIVIEKQGVRSIIDPRESSKRALARLTTDPEFFISTINGETNLGRLINGAQDWAYRNRNTMTGKDLPEEIGRFKRQFFPLFAKATAKKWDEIKKEWTYLNPYHKAYYEADMDRQEFRAAHDYEYKTATLTFQKLKATSIVTLDPLFVWGNKYGKKYFTLEELSTPGLTVSARDKDKPNFPMPKLSHDEIQGYLEITKYMKDVVYPSILNHIEQAQLKPYKDALDSKEFAELTRLYHLLMTNKEPRNITQIIGDKKWITTTPDIAGTMRRKNRLKHAYEKLSDRLTGIREERSKTGFLDGYFPQTRPPSSHYLNVFQRNQNKQNPGPDILVANYAVSGAAEYDRVKAELITKNKEWGDANKYEFKFGRSTKPDDSTFFMIGDVNTTRIIDLAIGKAVGGGVISLDQADTIADSLYHSVSDLMKARGAGIHSIHRNLMRPEGVEGYIEKDSRRVFNGYVSGYYGMQSKFNAAMKYAEIAKSIPDNMSNTYTEISNMMKDTLRNMDKWDMAIAKTKGFIFYFHLAGKISMAYMQMTQNFVTAIPRMAAEMHAMGIKDGWFQAEQYILKAMREANMFKEKQKIIDPQLKIIMEELDKSGDFYSTFVKSMELESLGANSRMWKKTLDFLSIPMKTFEEFNRRTAAIAMYHMIKDKAIYDTNTEAGKKRLRFEMQEFMLGSHFYYSKSNQPISIQGGTGLSRAGSLLYTFTSFPHNFVVELIRSFENYGGIGGLIYAARSMAYLSLFGGLMALPWLDDFIDMVERITNQPIRIQTRRMMEKYIGVSGQRLLAGGLPGILGMDLSASIRPAKIPFYGDPTGTMFGVYGGMLQRVSNFWDHFTTDQYLRAMEDLSPTALENIFKARRLYEQGVTKTSGAPVFGPENEQYKFDIGKTALQLLSIKPYSYGLLQQDRREQQIIQEEWEKMYKKLSIKYRTAQTASERKLVWDQYRELNTQIPDYLRMMIQPHYPPYPDRPDIKAQAYWRSL